MDGCFAEQLRADLRQDYLRNLVTTYTLNGDKAKALQLYNELGKQAEPTLSKLLAEPGFLSTEQITRFTTALGIPIPQSSGGATTNAPLTLQDGTEITLNNNEPEKKSNTLLWLGFGLLAILELERIWLTVTTSGKGLWNKADRSRTTQPRAGLLRRRSGSPQQCRCARQPNPRLP